MIKQFVFIWFFFFKDVQGCFVQVLAKITKKELKKEKINNEFQNLSYFALTSFQSTLKCLV